MLNSSFDKMPQNMIQQIEILVTVSKDASATSDVVTHIIERINRFQTIAAHFYLKPFASVSTRAGSPAIQHTLFVENAFDIFICILGEDSEMLLGNGNEIDAQECKLDELFEAYEMSDQEKRPYLLLYVDSRRTSSTRKWSQGVKDFLSRIEAVSEQMKGEYRSYQAQDELENLLFRDLATLFFQELSRGESRSEHSPAHFTVDWGEAPQVETFYGRDKELALLERWMIRERCQQVMIVGAGGMGKTALAVKITEHLKESFEFIFWRSLQNAPRLGTLLEKCLLLVSNQQQIVLPEALEDQIHLLMQYLRQHRCLIILDNVETILQKGQRAGHYLEGYEEYGQLIHTLGSTLHQSCLLLTGREKLKEVAHLEGNVAPVRSMQLLGLKQPEGLKLLKEQELFGTEQAWQALINLYAGNPLALKLVAEPVRDLFAGDVDYFLKEGSTVPGELSELLDQQFLRLSALEHEIMYWLAVKREAVTLEEVRRDMLTTASKSTLLDTLHSLRRRSMLEVSEVAHFTLQPVIMEYVTGQLIYHLRRELQTGGIDLFARYAIVQSQTRDYIREIQIRLILMPLAQEWLFSVGKEGLVQMIRGVLTTLHQTHRYRPGYAAGNLLNILVQLDCDLQGLDFAQLSVWQAYLKGVRLPGVNFAEADLTGSVFTETFSTILSVVFSPDGELLAAGTGTGDVHVWNAVSGTPLLTCRGHFDGVWAVAFSPDGNTLVTSSEDQTIRLWDIQTGQLIRILRDHTDRVWWVAFSPDGRWLISASHDQTMRLWDYSTGQSVRTFKGHSDGVWSSIFSSDGQSIVSGGLDGTIRLWDYNTGQCIRVIQAHSSGTRMVLFHPDGKLLASAGRDNKVRLWESSTGVEVATLHGHTKDVRSVSFNSDGTMLASGSHDCTVRLWETSGMQTVRMLQGHTNRIWTTAFRPDGRVLASGSDDQTLRLWDAATGQCLSILHGHTNRVRALAFSPDGSLLASSSEDNQIRLWDTEHFRCLHVLHGHTAQIRSLAFSPGAKLLASGAFDHTIRLWDTMTGRCLHTFQGHTHSIWSVAFTSDGQMLASGSDDHTLRFWDISTRQSLSLYRVPGTNHGIKSIAFSPDGKVLAGACSNQIIYLWDLTTGQDLAELHGHTNAIMAVAFSPDGQYLASGSEDWTVRLWQSSSRTCQHILRGHGGQVWAVAFHPDGTILASGSHDQTIRFWDIQTGTCLRTLEGHNGQIRSIAFTPDGNFLTSGGHDETIKLWRTADGVCLKTWRSDRPYEDMNITDATGLTQTQRATLKLLGAIEDGEDA